jgi:hypothetical protein
MRYLDSGRRDPQQALGTWLSNQLAADVDEVRWQSGFFAADSLGLVQPAIEDLVRNDRVIRALIGSNDQTTIRNDVRRLVQLLGIPRGGADLGVVSYRDGFFHPKTFHIRRNDGSEVAYVGSANLTGSGVAALHVEAGITIDTREGDSIDILQEIATAVDNWFDNTPPGLYRVGNVADVDDLYDQGILADARPPRRVIPRDANDNGVARPLPQNRLRPLIAIPRIRENTRPVEEMEPDVAVLRNVVLPVAPRNGFPQYLLFAPNATVPTQGVAALTGSSLPMGASGLVIRLNRDNARHFEGRGGTANFSVPVATLSTIRFGMYSGRTAIPRPRAEFPMRTRFLHNGGVVPGELTTTNIMAYGFIPGESGHGDIRMLFDTSIRVLAQRVRDAGMNVPEPGDMAIVEWPTSDSGAEFRLTFVQTGTALSQQLAAMFQQARDGREIVGNGACWLPNGVSPDW